MTSLPPSRVPNVPDDPLIAAMRAAFGNPVDAPRGRVSVRYDVKEQIAHGGMGIVWRGFDIELSREVAIKTLQPGLDAHDAIVLRFANEARITGRLQHPGIVPVYEHGRLPDGRPFLTMKLIGGETLRAILEAPASSSDRRRLLSIFEQVVQTLGYAHSEGIVHRDLKPENVMVGAFGEVQVVDWGLALDLRGDGSRERGVVGTPGYMAPEQERGEHADTRADVWALGTILREIVGGRPDPELIALIDACRAAEAEQRPRDAGELGRRLSAYLSAFDARARRAEERRRTRPLRLSLAAAILLVVALGTIGVVIAVNQRIARTDRELAETLDELRARWGERGDLVDFARDDADFARAFRDRAVDVDSTDVATAIAALRGDWLATELAQALDSWALGRRRDRPQQEERWQRLVRIANGIDPDARGRAVRRAIHDNDAQRLRELAAASKPESLPPGTWVLLAEAIGLLGDKEAATAAFERAQAHYQGDFWLCFHVGRWNQRLEPPRDAEALRFFSAAVSLRPGSTIAHGEVGGALLALNRHDEAAAAYRRAIELRPGLAKMHHNLSLVLRKKGDIPGAAVACRRTVELDPTLTNAWFDLATMLRVVHDSLAVSSESGQTDQLGLRRLELRAGAIESLRKGLALRHGEPHAHYNLGVFMLEEEKLDEAIASFREAARLAPEHPRADTQLGLCLFRQGLPGPALEHLTKGRENAASEGDWDDAYDEVIAECKRLLALEKAPERERDPRALVELGRLALGRKDAKQALALFESAFEREPSLRDDIKTGTRYAAARAAAMCGERARALAWLQQDLARWDELLASGSPAAKRAAREALAHWQKDPELASLRPDDFWKQVEAVLKRESQ